MDPVDPLAEGPPPRYQYESDESEDEFNPLHIAPAGAKSARQTANVEVVCEAREGQALIIVASEAALAWTSGVDLGNEIGTVRVNATQIGTLYSPSWSSERVNILVSEAHVALPLWAMHSYAETVLTRLNPSRVVLVDAYAVHSYITSSPLAVHEAPVRFLKSSHTESLSPAVQPFAPPNLIQSTSAAFLSLLALPRSGSEATPALLLLLPSPHIPAPPPTSDITPRNTGDDESPWSADTMQFVHDALCKAVHISAGEMKWLARGTKGLVKRNKAKIGEIGDGSLYI